MTVNVSSVPAVAGSGAAVLVTFRSAERLTVVVEVELLLPATGSLVASVAIEAVLASVPPSAKPEPMWTVMVNVSVGVEDQAGAGAGDRAAPTRRRPRSR